MHSDTGVARRHARFRRYEVTAAQSTLGVATLYGRSYAVGSILIVADRQAKRYVATGQLTPATGPEEETDTYVPRSPRYGLKRRRVIVEV